MVVCYPRLFSAWMCPFWNLFGGNTLWQQSVCFFDPKTRQKLDYFPLWPREAELSEPPWVDSCTLIESELWSIYCLYFGNFGCPQPVPTWIRGWSALHGGAPILEFHIQPRDPILFQYFSRDPFTTMDHTSKGKIRCEVQRRYMSFGPPYFSTLIGCKGAFFGQKR